MRAEQIVKTEEGFSEKTLYDPDTRTLFVAADEAEGGAGVVYSYINEGLYWRPSQEFRKSGVTEFGHAMALDDGRLIISAPGSNRVYYYEYISDKWTQRGTYINGDSHGKGRFGSSVAIDGTNRMKTN